jgi:glutamine synthetase
VDAALERLPTSLDRAIDNFEESAFAREVYGDMFANTYRTMLRHEVELFEKHVTDWELGRYIDVM